MPKSPIPAPKVLLMGSGGSGKTYALRTLVEAGITPFIIALDAQGIEILGDIPCPKLHWITLRPKGRTWETMLAESKRLASLQFDGIAKTVDTQKYKQDRWINTLQALSNFRCERCDKSFGPVDDWPTSRAVVIDHFTELCAAAKEWAVGEKLVLHEGEWQIAQNNVENIVRQLYNAVRTWVIVLAHIDRETDLVLGGSKIMVHALGRKLAPKLNPLFSDVILASRAGNEFTWDCAAPDTDLKTRNLPIERKLRPDFRLIVNEWTKRGGIIEEEGLLGPRA